MSHWRRRLIAAVSSLESGVRGLSVNGYRPPDSEDYRPSKTAAVLVPFLDLPEPELVLTRRADHLPQHPGQVSFPGGAAEDDDGSAVQTALREAQEDIGLPPEAARPIGFLDRMDTISDYRVSRFPSPWPWIGSDTRAEPSTATGRPVRFGHWTGRVTKSGALRLPC
jgi:8-oxo-dGTP pyrophosphatase MutT (NUDIX family)